MMGLALLTSLSLSGCATEKMRSRQNVLTDTLQAYAGAIRWGEVEQAQGFLDPKLRLEHPPTALELARFKQVRVTAYDEQPAVPAGDNEVHQTVEIGLVNINSQVARSVIDHQVWHYDEAQKRWWLTSGLPDITHQQ
jgi:hypothetical protein